VRCGSGFFCFGCRRHSWRRGLHGAGGHHRSRIAGAVGRAEHGDQVDAAVRVDDHAGKKIGEGDLVDGKPGGVHADVKVVEKQGIPFEKVISMDPVDGGKPVKPGLACISDYRFRPLPLEYSQAGLPC
jgi:hypothetical protein